MLFQRIRVIKVKTWTNFEILFIAEVLSQSFDNFLQNVYFFSLKLKMSPMTIREFINSHQVSFWFEPALTERLSPVQKYSAVLTHSTKAWVCL